MAKPYFKINGTDILKYIESNGLKWQRNDVDASNAGRTMDATMHRGRVAIKIRWDVSLRPLTSADAALLLNIILPEYVEVNTNIDPLYGTYIKTFYSNNVPATCMCVDEDTGEALWQGIEFPLIEQ